MPACAFTPALKACLRSAISLTVSASSASSGLAARPVTMTVWRGGRAQMLDIVRKHDLFSDKPWHVFRRSGQDLQDFERSLQRTATEPRR